jgi:hypothetical protein
METTSIMVRNPWSMKRLRAVTFQIEKFTLEVSELHPNSRKRIPGVRVHSLS